MGKGQNLEVEMLDAAQALENLASWLKKSKLSALTIGG
jgi:hypothetical protein